MGFNLGKAFEDFGPAAGNVLGTLYGGPATGAILGSGMGMWSDQQKDARMAAEQRAAIERQTDLQKEFAQMGVRWRAEDARKAGIHPLAALGAQTHSYAPVVGDMGVPRGARWADFGQDVTRALASTQSAEERTLTDLQIQSARLDVEGKALDNAHKQSMLNRQNGQTGPAFPGDQGFIDGQGDSRGRIMNKPMERTRSLKGSPHSEPGAVPDVGWVVSSDNALVPVPSKDAKERTEDVMPHEYMHFWRNNVMPNFGGGPKPPREALPGKDYTWQWDYSKQGYVPRKLDRNKYRGNTWK